MKGILILLICLSTHYAFLKAQSCTEFFPIGNIQSIIQNGNDIWIGTSDNGLVKFDKTNKTSQYFTPSNSNLTTNYIKSTCWHDNKLYFSTDEELMYLENGNVISVNDTINGLLIESHNGELVVVDKKMVYFLQNNQIIAQYDLKLVNAVRPECCDSATSVTIDAMGNLWISRYAFYEFDILKFDGLNWNSFHIFNTPALPIESFMLNGISSFQNTIFATSYGHIHQYQQGQWNNLFDSASDVVYDGQDTLSEMLASIYSEHSNILWVGTDGRDFGESGQLFYHNFQNNTWHSMPTIDSLPSIIKTITTDSTTVFIGTNNGLGLLDKNCFSVSNQSISKIESISIYPNPTDQNITIAADVAKYQIAIYNTQGQLIRTNIFSNQKNTIDLSELSTGTYFIKFLNTNNQLFHIQKLIKL